MSGCCSSRFHGLALRPFARAWGSVALLAGIVTAQFSGAAQVSFSHTHFLAFAAGSYPTGLAVADMDGDGRLDLVTSNQNDNSVSVLLGGDFGTFQPPIDSPTGTAPQFVAVGDLNGDGAPDVVTPSRNSTATISVLLGHGDGSMATPVDYATPSSFSNNLRALVLADFDRDGHLDVIVTSDAFERLSIFLGNGDGTLAPRSALSVTSSSTPPLVAADMNLDGWLDLLTRTTNGVLFIPGNGDGTFGPETRVSLPSFVNRFAAGDLNGDGSPDIAVSLGSANSATPGKLAIVPGHGDGTFGAPTIYEAEVSPIHVAIADLDGDAAPDLAVVNSQHAFYGTVSVWRGHGDGTFTRAGQFGVPQSPSHLATVDLDRDGALDLAMPSRFGNAVAVFHGNGDASFGDPSVFRVAPGTPGAYGGSNYVVKSGDMNGDAKLDLVAVSDDSISVLLGAGDGSFGPPIRTPGVFFFAHELDDVNGDGKLDLIAPTYYAPGTGDRDSAVSVWLGRGDGTFDPRTTFETGVGPYAVEIADLDRDGAPDLVVADGGYPYAPVVVGHTVSLLLGNGDGTFRPRQILDTADSPTYVEIADLDADGDLDLVVFGGSQYSVLLGNGDGTFAARTDHPGTALEVGDLDDDGIPDLVLEGLAILRGAGDGSFVPWTNVPVGPLNAFAGIEDVNLDGHPDLVMSTPAHALAVVLGDGNGTFAQRPYDFGMGTSILYAPEIGDFNRDGLPDVAAPSYATNTISVLLNTTPIGPTAVMASLLAATAEPNRVRLSWYYLAAAGDAASIHRTESDGRWHERARIRFDATGVATFEDTDVVPGRRYGYRLEVVVGGKPRTADEQWLETPVAIQLALAGAFPNPSNRNLVAAFTLPTVAPATLEVLDVSGRRVLAREVGTLGPGAHRLALDEGTRLAAGIYFLRLAQDGKSLVARAVLLN